MRGQKFLFRYFSIMILILIMNISTFNFLKNSIFAILFLMLNIGILIFTQGFEKDKSEKTLDANIIIFAYSVVYFIVIYTLGIITGYARTIYNHEFLAVVKNIVPVILVIILEEIIRYQVVTKTKGNKLEKSILLLMIIFFVLFDIRNMFPLKGNFRDLLDVISTVFLPITVKNVVFTLIVYLGGYKPTIFYRLITEIPIYIVPIYPNLGPYMTGIVEITFPVIMFFVVRNVLIRKKEFYIRQKKYISKIISIPIITVLIISVMLVSNYFKYYALSIVSNSMYPEIARGDVVIVKKLNDQEKEQIKLGDVLIYSKDNKVIVHRVVYISDVSGESIYVTKGDNNNTEDNYVIKNSEVIGVALYKIPIIGYPSVWLSEMR